MHCTELIYDSVIPLKFRRNSYLSNETASSNACARNGTMLEVNIKAPHCIENLHSIAGSGFARMPGKIKFSDDGNDYGYSR